MTVSPAPQTGPVTHGGRIASLDVLRGIAILGILLMNIQSFSMPVTAYNYPWSWGDMTGINGAVYYVTHVIASGKFISIFAMLFGAGILLQSERMGADRDQRMVHLRRMFGLLAIGLAHAYLLWYGDILFSYALLGIAVFFVRRFSIRTLLLIAGSVFAIGLIGNLLLGGLMHLLSQNPEFPVAEGFNPPPAVQMEEVNAYRGTWFEQMPKRALTAVFAQTFLLAIYTLPLIGPLMLLGMALMKSGFFSGGWTRGTLSRVALTGILLGWSLSVLGLWLDAQTGHQPALSAAVWYHVNTLAMVPTALGYAALVMLLTSSGVSKPLAPFAAVGKTALSCYLLQTLLCTTIFYGHGFGYFGSVSRVGQLGIVVGVWIVVLVFASLWTRYFRYGPAEWVWRGMTYGFSRI